MTDADELRALRAEVAELREAVGRLLADGPTPSANRLMKTAVIAAYPTAPLKYFALQPVDIRGAQAEGAAPTLTARAPKTLGLLIGTTVPTPGSYVVAARVDSTWVFRG